MIEFLTLFVGLVLGVQTVEVVVSGPVSRVEIRIDDGLLAEIDGPPWIARCDFGRRLHPARLDAIAYDGEGTELARVRRWINLPGMRADAEIIAIRDGDRQVRAARLTWSSPEFTRPRRISAELDGRRIRVKKPYRIDLTKVPERKIHVLSVEFDFAPGVVVRRELVFGPAFEGAEDSGLTALAVVLEDLDELPRPEEMDGWFQGDDGPLAVAAVEKPDARVVIVRDPTVVHRLAAMGPELEIRRKKAARGRRAGPALDAFGDDVQLFALSPEPVQPDGRPTAAVLFPFSDQPTAGKRGLLGAAVGSAPASLMGGPLMMADAVAVAAVRAAEGNGRRAVVLLLGERRQDGSRFPPEIAIEYLRELRVPLFVWDLSGPAADIPSGWGDARPVDNVDDLERRVRRIRYQLEEQRIVWLRGRHLPQEIGLSEKARGIRLAE